MTHRRLYTILLASTWVAALIVALDPWGPLRAAAGLLLFLVLPGTLATYAALPPDPGVEWRMRVVLSVAVSACIGLVVGLALALAFDEVSRAAVAVALAALASIAAAVSFARGGEADGAVALPALPRVSPVVALVSAILLVACTGLAVATLDVDSLPGKFTALTLTREGDAARLTTENRLGRPMRYRYEIRGDGRLLRSGRITVGDDGARSLLMPIPSGLRRLEGLLYIGGRRPYRSVSLQIAEGPAAAAPAAP